MRDDRLRHGCFQDGRLSLLAAGTAFITFTIEILHFHAGWDVDDFRTNEFFAYRRKCAATFWADRRFRFDDKFSDEAVWPVILHDGRPFLAFVRLDRNFRFQERWLTFCFGFIERAHLFLPGTTFLISDLRPNWSLAAIRLPARSVFCSLLPETLSARSVH